VALRSLLAAVRALAGTATAYAALSDVQRAGELLSSVNRGLSKLSSRSASYLTWRWKWNLRLTVRSWPESRTNLNRGGWLLLEDRSAAGSGAGLAKAVALESVPLKPPKRREIGS
jgi:hypothetical protein